VKDKIISGCIGLLFMLLGWAAVEINKIGMMEQKIEDLRQASEALLHLHLK